MRRIEKKSGGEELSESRVRELGLTDNEQKEIKERGRVNAVVIHEVIRLEGEHELCRPPIALVWSGLAACQDSDTGSTALGSGVSHQYPWGANI